jgi:catalase
VTTLRYRIVPVAKEEHLDAEALKDKSATYLFDEVPKRLKAGPIEFKLLAQIAEEGDVTDNATVIWPEEREIVELGTLKVEKNLGEEESRVQQKHIIFDPIPRVEGIEASDDPLLEVRASVYLVSGKQRRADKSGDAVNANPEEVVKATS